MNNKANLRFYRSLVFLSLALVLVFPYKYLFGLVGAFPAESVDDAQRSSFVRDAVCWDAEKNKSLPKLAIAESEDINLDLFLGGSNALYFDKSAGLIFAMDVPRAAEQNLLEFLAKKKLIDPDWYDFQTQAVNYYEDCIYPIDKGLAEAYWATKGTSVLHHWAHLYEGALGFGGHSQYGTLIPIVGQFLAKNSLDDGPTAFVKFSWWIYYSMGVIYFLVLLAIFHKNPFAVLLFGLIKIAFFFNLGAFAILIAPGFQWSRELVFVSVGFFANLIQTNSAVTSGYKKLILAIIGGCLFSALYFIDPVYFIVSFLALILALLLNFRVRLAEIVYRKSLVATVVVGVIVALGVLAGLGNINKLQYIYDKLSTLGGALFGLGGTDFLVVGILFVVAVAFLSYSVVVKNIVWVYFSIVSMASLIYYLITPDRFHFLKYVEYCIPLFLCIYVAMRSRWQRANLSMAPIIANASAAIVFFLAFLGVLQGAIGLTAMAREGQLFTRDYSGDRYFTWKTFVVNGKSINIDASDEFIEHLRNFPKQAKTDYVLSPYDKHIVFLYDKRNGFGSVDLVSSLDSQARLDQLIGRLKASDSQISVVVDKTLLDFQDVSGVYMGHQPFGSMYLSSNLYRKSRLRANKLASFVSEVCVEDVGLRSGRWGVFKCSQ